MIERYEATNEPEEFEIYAVNSDAIDAFLSVQTQMRGNGFRYEGVRAGLELAGIECTPELFDDLQLMEATVVNHVTKQKTRRHG